MSVITSTVQQISGSLLNKSKSKQLFSFGKEGRFRIPKHPPCSNFYNLPSTKMKLSSSFGIGNRCLFRIKKVAPDPSKYDLPSDFDKTRKKGSVFSFGINRSAYSKVYIEGGNYPDSAIPGPGAYEVREIPGKSKLKYSFRPKTSLEFLSKEIKKHPGPGSYKVLPSISPSGFHFYSRFDSSKASVFHPPNSVRFKEMNKTQLCLPGPTSYDPKINISGEGNYFISTLKSSIYKKFSNFGRDKDIQSENIKYPGPGSYRAPSEFGYYSASEKYIKEYERVDKERSKKLADKYDLRNLKNSKYASQTKVAPIDNSKVQERKFSPSQNTKKNDSSVQEKENLINGK